MSESKENKSSNFQSKEEAFEYLVQQSQNKAIKDKWRKELEQLPDAPPENKRISRMFFIKGASVAAAVFTILLGTFFWYSNQNESLQQIAGVMINETNFMLESASVTRGSQELDNVEIKFQKEIGIAFEEGDYENAARLFSKKENNRQLTVEDKFYYALSLARAANGDYHKAIRMLADVTKREEKYYTEGLWLQALLNLKINESKKSKLILIKLNNISNYQIKNTKALLEKMPD